MARKDGRSGETMTLDPLYELKIVAVNPPPKQKQDGREPSLHCAAGGVQKRCVVLDWIVPAGHADDDRMFRDAELGSQSQAGGTVPEETRGVVSVWDKGRALPAVAKFAVAALRRSGTISNVHAVTEGKEPAQHYSRKCRKRVVREAQVSVMDAPEYRRSFARH